MSDTTYMWDSLRGVYTDPFSEVRAELNALRKRVEQLERTTEQKPHAAEQTAWFIEYYYGSWYYTAHDGFVSLKSDADRCKSKAVRCKSKEDADAVIRILNLIGCKAVLLNSVTMAPVEVTELNYD